MESIFTAMRRCQLFDGIPEDKYQNVLNCLHGEVRTIPRNTVLLRIGERQRRPGVVMSGTLRISLYSEDGNLLTIDRLSRGRVFGESLVCSMSEDSPIQIDALTETEVLYLDFDPLLLQQENGCPYRMRVTANLLREMGKGALFLNQKMRILAQNRLRNRIKVYLQGLPIASNGEIRLEMGRGEMADYLCVDRSALSRELGRMQKEGILTYQGQVVHILDSVFLPAGAERGGPSVARATDSPAVLWNNLLWLDNANRKINNGLRLEDAT